MANEKIYIGNGKEHTFPNGGKQWKIRLKLNGMKEYFEKYGFTTDNGNMYINAIMSERREIDEKGNTHYLTLDTFKPTPKNETSAPADNNASPPEKPDDIPF